MAASAGEVVGLVVVELATNMSDTRPSWDQYFLDIARQVATRSTCLRVPDGIGAVIVRDRQILATGYCGSIKGQPHCVDVGCLIDEKVGGCIRTVHAEINAILQASVRGISIKDACIYTTMSPCLNCFKAIANAGVTRVVYAVEYRIIEPQFSWARSCGISWEHIGTEKYVPKPVQSVVESSDDTI